MKRFKLAFLGILLLLGSMACVVIVTPVPTLSLPTAAAANSPTQAVLLIVSPRPSVTPIPAPTRRPTAAMTVEPAGVLSLSATPAVIVETVVGGPVSTATYIPFSFFNSSPTPPPLMCEVEMLEPAFGQDIKPRTDFMATWRIYNTGSASWSARNYFFEYVNGDKLYNGEYVPLSLGFTIYPKDKITFRVHLKSPKAPGRYISTWGLRKTNKDPFCTFSVVIDVVK